MQGVLAFVHFEHVNLVNVKDIVELLVADDEALVLGILKIICLYIVPNLFDSFWARELLRVSENLRLEPAFPFLP